MNHEQLGLMIVAACCWLCALVIIGIAVFTVKQEKAATVWPARSWETEGITDIAGFNQEVSRLWKWYSLPFWVAGPLWLLNGKLAALVVLLACIPGYPVLALFFYKRTVKRYRAED